MKQVDDYWARFFGLPLAEFLSHGTKVVPHLGLQGYDGTWLFRRGASTIISAPPHWVEPVSAGLQNSSQDGLTDDDFITMLGSAVGRVIGPAYQGYLDETEFHPIVTSARLLSTTDDIALRELAVACDSEEWEHSDIQFGQQPIFGVYAEGCLVAASTYRIEAEGVAMPGIITHPQYRGRGYGKAVLSAATQDGLSNGLLMLYQTLLSNKAAIAAAEGLSYKQYATQLAIRLHQ